MEVPPSGLQGVQTSRLAAMEPFSPMQRSGVLLHLVFHWLPSSFRAEEAAAVLEAGEGKAGGLDSYVTF